VPVNRTRIVEEADGSRYVEREYAWPYGEPDELDRPEKEAWLAAIVRGHGIPAPRELSRTTEGGRVVVRREYLPGRPLGDVPVTCAPAWRAAGAMLARVHAIRLGDRAGVIAGREVRPFPEGSWGRWQLANAVRHAPAAHRRPTYERAVAYVAGLDGELARLERLD
jgi:hypothetical protein